MAFIQWQRPLEDRWFYPHLFGKDLVQTYASLVVISGWSLPPTSAYHCFLVAWPNHEYYPSHQYQWHHWSHRREDEVVCWSKSLRSDKNRLLDGWNLEEISSYLIRSQGLTWTCRVPDIAWCLLARGFGNCFDCMDPGRDAEDESLLLSSRTEYCITI